MHLWTRVPSRCELRAKLAGRLKFELVRISSQSSLTAGSGSIVRVTGHFSDPASTTCVLNGADWSTGEPLPAAGPDPRIAELYCREQFVVDAYEIIGTDPDFGA